MHSLPGRIRGQKLFFNDISLQRFLEKNEGKRVDLVPRATKRTLTQNSYYHLYLDAIAHETGNDHDELHSFFRQRFLPYKTVKIVGKQGTHEFTRLTSTTELSKAEFTEYLDKIAAMTAIPLPDPEAAGYLPH